MLAVVARTSGRLLVVMAAVPRLNVLARKEWFGTLVAADLQMAFMTPPFGSTLFYRKGTAPPT